MKLGPIQKQWLADLRKYPQRQYKSGLGLISPEGDIKACCLGQALITICELEGVYIPRNSPSPHAHCQLWGSFQICDGESNSILYLTNSYKKLGLYDKFGSYIGDANYILNNTKYNDLSQMNDNGISWAKIADYIEANPENVFTESK